MRIALTTIAAALIALGLWLIAAGFTASDAPVPGSSSQFVAKPQTTAGPIALGLALLVGGGVFFVMLLRRR